MDQVFNTLDTELAELLLDDFVIGDGNSLLIDSSKTSLIDESFNGFLGGVSMIEID